MSESQSGDDVEGVHGAERLKGAFPPPNPGRRRSRSRSARNRVGAESNGADRRMSDRRASDRRATLETSAGGVVYRVDNGTPLVLLIRDSYRNWGFPKGHLQEEEKPAAAALREVQEETGLDALQLDGKIETIDWFFRFRGKLIHKVCHFFLMRSRTSLTTPQAAEGITACRWVRFDEADRLVSYANAREVLALAQQMIQGEGLAPEAAHA